MEDATEKKARKFKVGDRVYAPFHKYGTIVEIDETDRSYPITVQWDESRYKIGIDRSTFTEDGYLFFGDKTENTKITKVEGEKMGQIAGGIATNISNSEIFHEGDHVWSPHFGQGIVKEISDNKEDPFPVKVMWESGIFYHDYDEFTKDGKFDLSGCNPDLGIYSLEYKYAESEGEKYHVGDRVKFVSREDGRIINISQDDKEPYPIEVAWLSTGAVSSFTKDGYIFNCHTDNAPKLTVVKDESTVERMEDALSKKVDDAINPSHYRVEGLPDAIDIINHLMHREQYEGFLWGNIMKYAYRYGKKGDKAETAGKIAWYATQLKELDEERK